MLKQTTLVMHNKSCKIVTFARNQFFLKDLCFYYVCWPIFLFFSILSFFFLVSKLIQLTLFYIFLLTLTLTTEALNNSSYSTVLFFFFSFVLFKSYPRNLFKFTNLSSISFIPQKKKKKNRLLIPFAPFTPLS